MNQNFAPKSLKCLKTCDDEDKISKSSQDSSLIVGFFNLIENFKKFLGILKQRAGKAKMEW